MKKDRDRFELDYGEGKLQVQRHTLGDRVVFRVSFPGKKAPLVLTRATHANAFVFWTSIPEGRQSEAEEIGPLIEEYYK